MKLFINDLPRNDEMTSKDMALIQGGMLGLGGLSQTGASPVDASQGTGKVTHSDFDITMRADVASPKIYLG